MDYLEKLSETIESELEKLSKKPELSVTEIDSATKAMCLLQKIHDYLYELEESDDDDGGKSGRRSGGMYYDHYGNRSMDGRHSYRRDGENTYDGRSRMGGDRRTSYDTSYSGHSVKDRMISKLEDMMDDARSDYERSAISEWISKIEREK